ncbi:MAG: aerobic carbon-monoxide dehydrogenase large subunit [Solirubrobacteraceae bacterium]|jgi:carbon-monoxide dehydrogenase large subunit|nr:aerobic carbon-monoxide dehydrogenase large subunit [Solirubrobacteraceae bacterium]
MAEVSEATRPTVRSGVIGSSVDRKEDDRLLRGEGRFGDDIDPAHGLHMAVGRCPFPHARIVSIDISEALRLEGVEDVLVGKDVAERSDPISVLRPVPDAPSLEFRAMATDVAVFEGHPVVSVAAVSRQVAEDAIALIDVEYEPLPHVFDVDAAMDPRAPVLHPHVLPSNLLASNPSGAGDPEAKLAEADVVLEDRFQINRVSGLPMETRVIVAEWQAGTRELTVRHSTQAPHLVRKQLAESLRLQDGAVRVLASDVGGGFGLKLGIYPEDVLASLHAMALRRPVKWVEDRVEFFRASTHAREAVHSVRLGARADGQIVAMTDTYAVDLGGYNSPFGSPQLSSVMFTGPYRIEDARTERRVTITNKAPIGAYRGYGQPESCFVRELLVDRLARRLGRDRVELRIQNMVRPEDMPWQSTSGAIYDSGDYAACLRMAAEAIGYDEHVRRGRGPREDGRHVGVGIASFVERTGYAGAKFLANRGSRFGAHESVILRANRSGGVDVYSGVSAFGAASETAFAQIVCDVVGIDYDDVRVHVGDTAASPLNTGGFASRTLIAAAGALKQAGEELRAKILRIAAFMLEADPEQVTISQGSACLRDDPSISVPLSAVHDRAIVNQGMPPGEDPGLEATAHFEPEAAAYAFGTAAALVSVDVETGDYDVERFVMVHDCGTPVNPKLVDGQVQGALAQGFGQAVMEELRYDEETGQLLNGTMLDYFMPTSADVPEFELHHTYVKSPGTPFGVRGVGEIGTIPGGATIANAICDALAEFGVEINRLPLTPELVWRALQDARAAEGAGA